VRFLRVVGHSEQPWGSVSRFREGAVRYFATIIGNAHPFVSLKSMGDQVNEVMIARRVLYEGRVQGVGFRYSVKSITAGYDVFGSVKNLIDGRVELEVQGEEGEVTEFLEAVLDSHLRRHIHRFVVHEIPVKSDLKGFEIRH
jgi:acylphosphatase